MSCDRVGNRENKHKQEIGQPVEGKDYLGGLLLQMASADFDCGTAECEKNKRTNCETWELEGEICGEDAGEFIVFGLILGHQNV